MDSQAEAVVEMVPVDRIQVNPYQPRRHISVEELRQLVESIRQHGMIQPIVVVPVDRGYQLIAGERRYRAAKIAGMARIPAIVRLADWETSAVLALVENLHRQSLSYWDQAEGFLRLHTEFQWTQHQIAETMGLSQSAVANKLRLLQLDSETRRRVQEAGLSERHARLLLAVEGAERRELLALMTQHKWTVRQAEEWVASRGQRSATARPAKAVVKDFRIVYNAFKKTLSAVEDAGMAVEMTQHEDPQFWEIRVRIPKHQEG